MTKQMHFIYMNQHRNLLSVPGFVYIYISFYFFLKLIFCWKNKLTSSNDFNFVNERAQVNLANWAMSN